VSGLKWVRLDCAIYLNHKIQQLTYAGRWRAYGVYINGLAYAGAQGTDGFIPDLLLPAIGGRKTDATQLVEVGLWIPRPGGWDINDWNSYQPSSDDTARRTAHAKAAAEARWRRTKPMLSALPDAMPDA
jgi:hypothetical protein